MLETLLHLETEENNEEAIEGIRKGIQGYMNSRKLDMGFLGGETGNVMQLHDVCEAF